LLNDIGVSSTPFIEEYNTSAYAQYTIQVNDRDVWQAKLQDAGDTYSGALPDPSQ
jgi:UDP-2-acetamido-2-deoxy-ribo-hexuluronate aminotransferase